MKLSVIIPVYNACNYIKKCIESILTNKVVDQIIIVDDGSTDDVEEVISSRFAKDERIIYIYQNNSGPAIARANGLKYVKNPYVTFIDSDDTVEAYAYDRLFEKYNVSAWDIVEFNFYIVDNYEKIISRTKKRRKSIRNKQCSSFFLKGKSTNYLWNKIFNVKIFENIITQKLYYAEDSYWLAQIFLRINNYLQITDLCYRHTVVSDSLCSSSYNNRFYDNIKGWLFIRDLYKHNCAKSLPAIELKLCSLAIQLYYKATDGDKDIYMNIFKEHRRNLSLFEIMRHGSVKRKVMVLLFPRFNKFIFNHLK